MTKKRLHILLYFVFITISIAYSKGQATDIVASGGTIYFDDFSQDPAGKFPRNWVSDRPGEVVTQKNLPGRWFKMHAQGTYLPNLNKDLPKRFTISFDFIHQAIGFGNNTTEITLFNKSKNTVNDALFPGNSGVKIVLETFIVSCLGYNNQEPANKPSAEYRSQIIKANHVTKVSIKVLDQTLIVSINGFDCLHVSNCLTGSEPLNAIRFYLWGSQAEPLISNFKIYQ